jgi:hypothetical protein
MKLHPIVDEAGLARLGAAGAGSGLSLSVDPAHKVLEAIPRGRALDAALAAYGVSWPIKKLHGADDHHTAMLLGIDNEGGGPLMLHNSTEGIKGTRVDLVRAHATTTDLTAFQPSSTTREQRLRAAAQALTHHQETKPGYPIWNLLLAGLNDLRRRLPFDAVALGGLLNSLARVCPPGQGVCSNLLPDAWAGQLGVENAATLFGVRDLASQGVIGFTPKGVRHAPGMVDVASYALPRGAAAGTVLKQVARCCVRWAVGTPLAPRRGTHALSSAR